MTDLVAKKERVKRDIRSLLISAPNGLSLSMLEKDYYAVTRERFPNRQFGFANPLEFAKSLNDILYVKLVNNQLTFFPIADESTKHVLKMVQNQRKPKKYNKFFPESMPSHHNRTQAKPSFSHSRISNYPPAFIRVSVHKLIKAHPEGFSVSDFPSLYKEVNGINFPPDCIANIGDIILNMHDVARLEFGRKDRNGNNLYVFPSKTLQTYLHRIETKAQLDQSKCRLKNDVTIKATVVTCGSSDVIIQPAITPVAASVPSTTVCHSVKSSHTNHQTNMKAINVNEPVVTTPKLSFNNAQQSTDFISTDSGVAELFKSLEPPACTNLKDEIIAVLEDHPTGMWAICLPQYYKQKFKKQFDLKKIGYFSTIEFISTMADKVSICRPTECGDWILALRKFEINCKKIKKDEIDITNFKLCMEKLLGRFSDGIKCKSLKDLYQIHFGQQFPHEEFGFSCPEQLICELFDSFSIVKGKIYLHLSAEPWPIDKEIKVESGPMDAVGSGVCYNPPVMPSKEWDYFDIFISYVVSPGAFMIQVIGTHTTEALDKVMNEMDSFYSTQNAKYYRMPPNLVHIGQVCVTIYHGDKNWNRAIITSEPKNGFVEVFYVDYGDFASVAVSTLFLLKFRFHTLPAQMIRARLSHLQPGDLEKWSAESRRELLEMSKDKSLVALVTDTSPDNILSLIVCDTKQSDTVDLFFNDLLIEKGFATYVDDKCTPEEIQALRESQHNQEKLDETKPALLENSSGEETEKSPPVTTNCSTQQSTAPPNPTVAANVPLCTDDPPPYHLHEQDYSPSACTAMATNPDAGYILSRFVPPPPGFPMPSNSMKVEPKVKQQSGLTDKNNNYQANQTAYLPNKFVEICHFSDTLTFHFINYEGTLFLTSAEISAIFKPKSEDLLVPMLLLKEEYFEELVLANESSHAELFKELIRLKVKGAVVHGEEKQFISLYRVCDVPGMIRSIGHAEASSLCKFFDVAWETFKCQEHVNCSDSEADDRQETLEVKSQDGFVEVPKTTVSPSQFRATMIKLKVQELISLHQTMMETRESMIDEVLATSCLESLEQLKVQSTHIKVLENLISEKGGQIATCNSKSTTTQLPPFKTANPPPSDLSHSLDPSINRAATLPSVVSNDFGLIPQGSTGPFTNLFSNAIPANHYRSSAVQLKASSPPFNPSLTRLQFDSRAPHSQRSRAPPPPMMPQNLRLGPVVDSNAFGSGACYYYTPVPGLATNVPLQNWPPRATMGPPHY